MTSTSSHHSGAGPRSTATSNSSSKRGGNSTAAAGHHQANTHGVTGLGIHTGAVGSNAASNSGAHNSHSNSTHNLIPLTGLPNSGEPEDGTGAGLVPLDPVDFSTFPADSLRKYRDTYRLSELSPISQDGMLLNSVVGHRTFSFKHRNRITKDDLAASVKRHFATQSVRETDIIASFIYSVRHQDDTFKLKFPLS
ncbi:uncharacterized protein V1516DRAFT_679088 [Lipomyces oligophaga]|uniref:uncharacterized protein n=1 Tax=Lipomyces oligophaga TaxID=45792 RepID=UPI0034CF2AC0